MIELYTDGACGKAGDGGWAWVLIEDGVEVLTWESGSEAPSTNQRCELIACIKGLEYLKWQHPDWSVRVVSDSAYLVNCFEQRWYDAWWHNGWRTSSNGEIKNGDLWLDLLSLWEQYPSEISWKHVRGHQGDKWNEFCDELAVKARTS
ncbi:MAG: ribonuclease HI [Patescibacteria group bacterium]|nr:ribonuclease HI [Patescibacteria group bacterium]